MKKKPNTLFRTFLLCSALLTGANGRTWTSADGTKTFEATLKSYDAASGEVVVSLRNGRTQKFSQTFLSEADIDFLKTAPKPSTPGTFKELPDVLPDPDGEEADMSKPVQVYILLGQSNMLGFGKASTLQTVAKAGAYPYLVDEAGE